MKTQTGNEIKFTTDGKKVIVIGSLNSQEKIVQEIFIVDGSEIPSGEHFVVKSLHDAPAVSWKEENLRKIEVNYNSQKETYENELSRLRKTYNMQSRELRNKIEYAGKVLKNVSPDSFKTLVDYLTGEIKYIVKLGWDVKLIEWKDFIQNYEDELRLISVYGKDDGTMTYAIGDYYDYSGGNKHFKPFNNYDDAFDFFKKELLKAPISEDNINMAKTYKIKLDREKLKKYYSDKLDTTKKSIESHKIQINKWKENIKEIEKTMKS